MAQARLEHANLTVRDPQNTAGWLERIFGWNIRWEGPGLETGYTIHVGEENSYLALFHYDEEQAPGVDTYRTVNGLNHLAIVVDDLDAIEEKVKAEGFTPGSHQDYEPGRRFYFHDDDGLEIEVVQYT